MVQLNSKLANNNSINCTPTGVYHQDFSAIVNPQTKTEIRSYDRQNYDYKLLSAFFGNSDDATGGDFARLDPQVKSDFLRYSSRIERYNFILNFYGISDDEAMDTHKSRLDSQIELDMRRHDLIASDFWGHYARRKNSDMTVGDIILPWVEVPNK
jgi:hypothetical protein